MKKILVTLVFASTAFMAGAQTYNDLKNIVEGPTPESTLQLMQTDTIQHLMALSLSLIHI